MCIPHHKISEATMKASSPLIQLKRKRNQRSVRFEEDDDRQVKRRVVQVESVLNIVDKSDLWIQPDEVAVTMQSVRDENQVLRRDTLAFEAYVDALADVYCVCCSDENDDTGAASAITPSHIALLGMARGTEPCSLPDLAVVRSERRRNAIQSVVQLDVFLRENPQREVLVAAVAENLSKGAGRFAQVLGAADATASLLDQLETLVPTPAFNPAPAPISFPIKPTTCALDQAFQLATVLV